MRILVVSDEEEVSAKLHDLLGKHGCVVSDVGAISAGPDLAARFKPEAVFVVLPSHLDSFGAAAVEIKDTSTARLVAVGPADDPQAILKVQREGGFHFVDQDRLEDDLDVALKRLRTEPHPVIERGRLIGVVSTSGGSGGSTVAVNVATALCKSDKGCALLDLNLSSGDLASLLQLDPKNSISDFCQNIERMDDSMFRKCLSRHVSGVQLLTRPARIREIPNISRRGIRKAISMSRLNFPYVVADISSGYDSTCVQVLHQADVIVLVMRPDFSSLRQTQRLVDHLTEQGVQKSRLRIVVNRYRRSADMKPKQIEEVLGMKLFAVIPDNPKAVSRANNKGIPIIMEKPRSAVSRRLRTVAENVNGAM